MLAMPPTCGSTHAQVSKGKEVSQHQHRPDRAEDHPAATGAGANGGASHASRGAVPKVENQFKGAGTNREALKAQFQAHVTKKQESAAQAVRQEAEDKKKYEDAKFAAQDEMAGRVTEWAGPKHNRKNLRGMLACFDLVTTWPRAREKWVKVGLHELVMPADVKKIHRKAMLLVHPGLSSPPSLPLCVLVLRLSNLHWSRRCFSACFLLLLAGGRTSKKEGCESQAARGVLLPGCSHSCCPSPSPSLLLCRQYAVCSVGGVRGAACEVGYPRVR